MQQRLITDATPLLAGGKLQTSGYSTKMNFVYDKKEVSSRALKEWDFYQIICGDKVLQMTIGHISWCAQLSANIFDIKTGQRRSVSQTLLNTRRVKKSLAVNPEKPNVVQWFGKKMKIRFETTPRYRRLTLTQHVGKSQIVAEIDVTLTNCSANKDKMVIATPFENPKQWYLNYKENCFVANGYCRIEDMEMEINNGNGVLDWGRGVWPRKHCWTWGNGSTVVEGKHFGFNIGWGFGDTSHATENMFFYDNKAYKLGDVQQLKVGDGFRYTDKEKKFVFDVEPLFDNFTRTKAPFVNNSCHQVFGTWKGHVTLADGKKVEIPPFVAFCEEANNCW